MSYLSKSDYDYINLAGCIRGQADWLGIDTEGVPLEGVVVRIANATPPVAREQDTREPSERFAQTSAVREVIDTLDYVSDRMDEFAYGEIRTAVESIPECESATAIPHEEHGEPGEPVRVQIAARRGGKHSTLADMIVERANARGVRVEFVEPDREPSDAEVEAAARRLWIYDLATAGDAEGAWGVLPGDAPIKKLYYERARAVLLTAQEVRRG